MKTRIIHGLTYRQNLRLLRQCYRHGYYCIDDDVSSFTDFRFIVLQKCKHKIYITFPDSYTDIWGIKHTWKNYLESKGVI